MDRYFEPKDNDSFLIQGPTYRGLLKNLEGFVNTLSIEDKSLFIKMISGCHHKLHGSIQAKSDNDIELFNSLILALLIEQTKEIERLQNNYTNL